MRKEEARIQKEIEKKEFEQRVVEIKRVTRVTSGGKQLSFRACVLVGDKNGRVGVGVAKGADVAIAVDKAINRAKKRIVKVPIINETIPHEIIQKYKTAKVLLRPVYQGRGIIAGGAVRLVLELAGIKNVVSKILGANSKINNIKATLEAFKEFKIINNH